MWAFKFNWIRTDTHANKECRDILVYTVILCGEENIKCKDFNIMRLRRSQLQIIFSTIQAESRGIKSVKKWILHRKLMWLCLVSDIKQTEDTLYKSPPELLSTKPGLRRNSKRFELHEAFLLLFLSAEKEKRGRKTKVLSWTFHLKHSHSPTPLPPIPPCPLHQNPHIPKEGTTASKQTHWLREQNNSVKWKDWQSLGRLHSTLQTTDVSTRRHKTGSKEPDRVGWVSVRR